jgi:ribosomal-protein-alanine N-acetyltransferase
LYQAVFQPGAPDRTLLVVEEHGELHGFLVARFSAAECELENLVVSASRRRRGFASQLLRALVSSSSERNTQRILLEVRESNTPARTLYEIFGFRFEGKRKDYYVQPAEDALVYVLTINCTPSSAPER